MAKKQSLSILINKNRDYLPALVLAGLSLVLIVIGGGFIFSYFDKRSEYQALQSDIEDLEFRISKLNALREGELANLQDIVLEALPPQKPVFNSLKAINDLALEANITLSELESRPGSVATASSKIIVNPQSTSERTRSYERLNIDLAIEGQLNAINFFLDQLVVSAPLMELKTVRITSDSISPDPSLQVFSSEIELEIYWKPIPPTDTTKINSNSPIEQLSDSETEIIESLEELRRF